MSNEEKYYEDLLNKFKEDPLYGIRVELGRMLMRHIDSFTPEERERYDYLCEILTSNGQKDEGCDTTKPLS